MKHLIAYSGLFLSCIAMVGCRSDDVSSSTPAKPQTPTSVATAGAKTGGNQARRSVKTSTDPDAARIDTTPKDTTIEDIVAESVPASLQKRAEPFETSTWRVKATLASVQLMKDGDYYLVLKGAKGGQTVVEVPDPAQCKGSPLEPQIAAARKQIEDKYHPTKEVQKLNDPATVTGVGFLGWGKSTNGSKKKGSESRTGPRLMPGTGFTFGQ